VGALLQEVHRTCSQGG